jgi:hypothetical protein
MRIDFKFNFQDVKIDTNKRRDRQVKIEDIEKERITNRKERYELAEAIRDKAKYYAPVKSGKMRDNIVIEVDNLDNISIVSLMEYSIWPHECIMYYHEAPTQAKFLEDGAIEANFEHGRKHTITIEYEPLIRVYIDPIDGRGLVISWGVNASEK